MIPLTIDNFQVGTVFSFTHNYAGNPDDPDDLVDFVSCITRVNGPADYDYDDIWSSRVSYCGTAYNLLFRRDTDGNYMYNTPRRSNLKILSKSLQQFKTNYPEYFI